MLMVVLIGTAFIFLPAQCANQASACMSKLLLLLHDSFARGAAVHAPESTPCESLFGNVGWWGSQYSLQQPVMQAEQTVQ